MTGCQPQIAAIDVIAFQDLKLGFRAEGEFTERTQYSVQPLGVELSCNVHTVHLQTGMRESLAQHLSPLTLLPVSVFGRMNLCAS